MVNPDSVISVFNGAIECLSTLLDTDVGSWIGGCIIVLGVIKVIRALTKI